MTSPTLAEALKKLAELEQTALQPDADLETAIQAFAEARELSGHITKQLDQLGARVEELKLSAEDSDTLEN
jgi:exonuclease VII small subunit